MPISVTVTAGGVAYGDIRVGEGHGIHQLLINAANVASARDADGYLPPGLPLKADGTLVAATQATVCMVGPEAVKVGSVNVFANAIFSGPVNRDMIEDNLGRVLSADELTGATAVGTGNIILR